MGGGNQVGYPIKQFVNNPTNWTRVIVIASVAFLLLGAYLWRARTAPARPLHLPLDTGRTQPGDQSLSKVSDVAIPVAVLTKGRRLRATHYLPYKDGFLVWWDNQVLRKTGLSFMKVSGARVTIEDGQFSNEAFSDHLKQRAIAAADVAATNGRTPPSSNDVGSSSTHS